MCQPLVTQPLLRLRLSAVRRTKQGFSFSPEAVSSRKAISPLRSFRAFRKRIPEIYETDTVQALQEKQTDLGLTEPEEAERAYQDHFLLILCENLATPAMMGYDTRMKG